MFIVSKRNIIIPGGKGREDVTLAKGFIGEIPDWVGETAYFKALVKDDKIALSETPKGKASSETPKGKARKKAEKPAKPPKEEQPKEPTGAPEEPEKEEAP